MLSRFGRECLYGWVVCARPDVGMNVNGDFQDREDSSCLTAPATEQTQGLQSNNRALATWRHRHRRACSKVEGTKGRGQPYQKRQSRRRPCMHSLISDGIRVGLAMTR